MKKGCDKHRPRVSGVRLRQGGWVYFVLCSCGWGYGGTGWENANLMAHGHVYLIKLREGT